MKKINLSLQSAGHGKEAVIGMIDTCLHEMLTLSSAKNISDLHYIRIHITRQVSIIIKMLVPFKASSSYMMYMYLYNDKEDQQQLLFSMAIQNTPNTIDAELKIASNSIAEITADILQLYPNLTNIIVVTNLDSDEIVAQRGFRELTLSEDPDTAIHDFIYWIGQNMDKSRNYAMARMSLMIYPNTPDEMKGLYEIMVECSEIFNEKRYSILFNYPYPIESEIGLSFDEFADCIYNHLTHFVYIIQLVCINDDIGTLKYYIQKQEVTNV